MRATQLIIDPTLLTVWWETVDLTYFQCLTFSTICMSYSEIFTAVIVAWNSGTGFRVFRYLTPCCANFNKLQQPNDFQDSLVEVKETVDQVWRVITCYLMRAEYWLLRNSALNTLWSIVCEISFSTYFGKCQLRGVIIFKWINFIVIDKIRYSS